jgi:penicillin-binding protein 1A
VTLLQAAMLAGMLKAPSRYNPAADPIASATRAQTVIDNMVDAGLLTEEQAQQAGTQSDEVAQDNQPLPPAARYFADWALDQVSSYIGITTSDIVVQTTLDPRMQGLAERDLTAVLARDGPKQRASEGALVALTPDGAVRALVGGVDYKQSQYNRATQAMRQPGSSFKAFVYLAAFEQGLTPDAQFVDAPISIGKWSPDNYNDKYFGQVTLREAFARSLNSVAVQLAQRVSPAQVVETAKRLGIDTPLGNDASIALGTSESTVLEMTGAYATFANKGQGVSPYGITKIATRDGQVLYQRQGSGLGSVASPTAVREMVDVMSATVGWGTGHGALIDRPAAGKTGTSQNYHDAWFIGLTGQLVTGVWVGNDDNSPMNKVTGGSLPVNIWHDFMLAALAGTPATPIPLPGGSGPLLAAGQPLSLPGSTTGPATSTASADEPGLLDRLVKSILGSGSEDDSGTVHQNNTAAQQPVPIWKNRDAQDARRSK